MVCGPNPHSGDCGMYVRSVSALHAQLALGTGGESGDPSLNQALVQGFVSQHEAVEGTEYDRDVELDDGSVRS
eukprot:2111216-Amphidinium_carterae.1